MNNVFDEIVLRVKEQFNHIDDKQRIRVGYSLRSIAARVEHLDFHLREIERIRKLKIESVGESNGICLRLDRSNTMYSIEIEAHTVAAVHGLHSVADILAQAIYLSLNDVNEWNGYLRNVTKGLPSEADVLKQKINQLMDHDDFKYLDRLANQAKHRAITAPVLMFSTTNAHPPKYEFSLFQRDGKSLPMRDVNEFLSGECRRQVGLITEIGIELCQLIKAGIKTTQVIEKQVCVKLSPDAKLALKALKDQHGSNDDAINHALIHALET